MSHSEGISLRADSRLWWPDYDHDPVKCLNFVRKGLTDMDLAISFCKKRRVCVQAGGHAGLWPMRLAEFFQCVYTFECEPMLVECMRRNCSNVPNVIIDGRALGEAPGPVKMQGHVSAGGWSIKDTGKHIVEQTTIDALKLKRCDALFFDVEAYEVEVLKGAWETIGRCRPVIMVEELPRTKAAIQAHMRSLEYVMRDSVHSDVVYTHASH